MAVTPPNPQTTPPANPLPADVNAVAITQLTQRVGTGTVMPEALPNDVNAPDIDYHVSVDTPAGAAWGGEGGPAGTYVPTMIEADGNGNFGPPAQGGNESQYLETDIPAPVQANLATDTTGGTLAANTYYYVVTAVGGEGETVASNEKSVTTTGSTSTVTVTWTEADAFDTHQYKVYRGTATGAENKLVATVTAPTLTFTDTGVAGTTATPPTENTTAPVTFTRGNVVTGAGANPYPNDVNAVDIDDPNPTSGGSNTPTFPDGHPSSSGDQSPT